MIVLQKRVGVLAEWTHDNGKTWTSHSAVSASFTEAYSIAKTRVAAGNYTHDYRCVDIMAGSDGAHYRIEDEKLGDGDAVACPHCKERQCDLFELRLDDEGSSEQECDSCGKPILITCSIDVTYGARAIVPLVLPVGEVARG